MTRAKTAKTTRQKSGQRSAPPSPPFREVWIIEAPPESYGVGTAFDTEKEARDEARCWGGFDVFGPFVLTQKGARHA